VAGRHISLTAAPRFALACAGAAHKRRRPVGLAKPLASDLFPLMVHQGKKLGAKHRKRDRASATFGRPRGA
jgi:hypothetical protein